MLPVRIEPLQGNCVLADRKTILEIEFKAPVVVAGGKDDGPVHDAVKGDFNLGLIA